MKDLLEKLKRCLASEENRRYLRFLVMPLVVIILIAVIMVMDKPETGYEEQTTEGTKEESGMVPEASTEETETYSYSMTKDEVPEIKTLMEDYLRARRTCDSQGLETVYGGTASEEVLQSEMQKLEEEVKYYQSFQNLVCYTVPGLSDGSYVVYARFDIQIRQAETLAPTMLSCYAKQAADGTYYLEAAISAEENEYIQNVNQSDEVQQMAAEVNSALRTAVESDENLLSVYYKLMEEETTASE